MAVDVFREYRLPRLPKTTLQVFEMVQDPDVGMNDLAEVIEKDPALASRMVRLSNSSFFGVAREVSSVRQALVVLGLRTVKMVALSCSVVMALPRSRDDRRILDLWRRVFTNAMGCRIAAPFLQIDPDEAFLAGMMQDILMLVFANGLGNEYHRMMEISRTDPSIPLVVLERDFIGISHADLAARWLEEWDFPSRVVSAVAQHHQVNLEEDSRSHQGDLAYLLAIAEVITDFLQYPSVRNFEKFNQAARGCGDRSQTDRFVQQLEIEVNEIADLLDFELPLEKSYEQALQDTREISRMLAFTPALIDPLTGALHREALRFRLQQEITLGRRNNKPLTVIFASLPIGETTLTEEGVASPFELALRDLAEDLSRNVRGGDSLFRVDIGMVCLLLPDCRYEAVAPLLQELNTTLLEQCRDIPEKCEAAEGLALSTLTIVPRRRQENDTINLEDIFEILLDQLEAAANREQHPSGILSSVYDPPQSNQFES